MTRPAFLAILTGCLLCAAVAATSAQTPVDTIKLGYLEGGKFVVYDQLRAELDRQLRHIAPAGTTFVFLPEAFGSGEWQKDSCRTLAYQLNANREFDLVVAMGPWTVEALLEANFKRPIVALHRFAPGLEGIIANNRPIASNLTVHRAPNRLESDLYALARLVEIDTLAVLYFPSGGETDAFLSAVASMGDALGFEVVTGTGEDIYGTFAPFAALPQVERRADAIYMPTMAGLDERQITRFIGRAAENLLPIFSSEGVPIVRLGALASNSGFTYFSQARFNANKILQIVRGATPADLPVDFDGETGLALNEATIEKVKLEIPVSVMRTAYTVEKPPNPDATYYSLTGAIGRVFTHNPEHLAQSERIEAAAHAAGQVSAELWPHLAGELEVGYADDNYVHNRYDEIDNSWLAGRIWLRQPILALETIRNAGVAGSEARLTETEAAIVEQQLELTTTAAYLGYLQAQRQYQFLAEYRQILDRIGDITRALRQLGDSLSTTAARAESERHQASADLALAETELTAARIVLNALFNLPGETPLQLDTVRFAEDKLWFDFEQIEAIAPSAVRREYLVNQLVGTALTQSPHAVRSDQAVALGHERLSANTARYIPRLDLSAGLGWADSLAEVHGFSDEQPSWTIKGVLSIPLFLGGSRAEERGRLQAELYEQEYRRDATSLRLMRQTRTRAELCLTQLDNLQPLLRSGNLARQHLTQTLGDFEAGRADISDLMEALHHHRQAGMRAISARYDYLTSLASVVYTAGFTPHDNGITFRQEFYRWLSETFR
ncbi:hypothetical protein GF356_10990 [candidate division GN15 bacterium]|nr:hypothetical protein [candidate division GN15 bacterium]